MSLIMTCQMSRRAMSTGSGAPAGRGETAWRSRFAIPAKPRSSALLRRRSTRKSRSTRPRRTTSKRPPTLRRALRVAAAARRGGVDHAQSPAGLGEATAAAKGVEGIGARAPKATINAAGAAQKKVPQNRRAEKTLILSQGRPPILKRRPLIPLSGRRRPRGLKLYPIAQFIIRDPVDHPLNPPLKPPAVSLNNPPRRDIIRVAGQ